MNKNSMNLFDSNKYLFGPKIFCLNQTNFVLLKQNISLDQRKCFKQIIFLIQSNIFLSVFPETFDRSGTFDPPSIKTVTTTIRPNEILFVQAVPFRTRIGEWKEIIRKASEIRMCND